jgi:hypothetical protein
VTCNTLTLSLVDLLLGRTSLSLGVAAHVRRLEKDTVRLETTHKVIYPKGGFAGGLGIISNFPKGACKMSEK